MDIYKATVGEAVIWAFYKAGVLPPLMCSDAEFNKAIEKGDPNYMRMVTEPVADNSIGNTLKSAFVFCAYKTGLVDPIETSHEEWKTANELRSPNRCRMVKPTSPDIFYY